MPPMRQPSSAQALYGWHRRALVNPKEPMFEGEPQCGFFRLRMVKGGPWIPARVWVEREVDPSTGELLGDERLRCDVGGVGRDPARVWTSLRPITRAAYDALVAESARNPAMAATMVPYDLSRSPMRP